MKVGLVLASSARAGAELFVVKLAKTLQREGDDVAVILLQPGEVAALLAEAGVRVIQLHMRSKRSLSVVVPLARRLGQERFDVVHAHGARAVAYAACAAVASPGTARLATVHQLVGGNSSRGQERLENLLYRRIYHRVIGVSRACCDDVVARRGLPREKVALIYNGIETAPSRPRIRSGRVIGALGRFSPAKGFDRLLQAFHLLAETDPCCRLVLGGDGPDRERLHSLGAAGCGRTRIEFTGLVTDTVEFFDRIDVLAIPSRTESFGLVAVEAMAQGVPVIATEVGGLCEVLDHGTYGHLVPEAGDQAFAAALRAVLDNRARRDQLAAAGPERARYFSIERCAAEHRAEYHGVRGRKK